MSTTLQSTSPIESQASQPKRLQPPSVDFTPLAERVAGELKWDAITRTLYASSASIVEIWPQAVLTPRNEGDVAEALRFCSKQGVPVTCRGAGSGVVGQSLGEGLIIDFSVHMNRVLDVDAQAREVICEPGVVKDDLDSLLATQGLFWPPDPSSSPWCTVGAMVANNSGGAKSVMYGTARDYLLELDCLSVEGEPFKLRPIEIMPDGGLRFAVDATEIEKRLAHHAYALVRKERALIKQHLPESSRCSSGYNIFQLLPLEGALPGDPNFDEQAHPQPEHMPQPDRDDFGANRTGSPWLLDMPRLFCGSEGSLAVLLRARFRVSKLPGGVAGAALSFESDEKMALAVVKLLRETRPAKLELLERSFIDVAAKAEPELAKGIPDKLKTQLIVEYFGDDEASCRAQVDAAIACVSEPGEDGEPFAFASRPAYDPSDLEDVWKIRKVASPILSRVKGDVKPTRWVEDLAVPPWKLPQFISGVMAIFKECGFPAALFGHAGEGNLHVNPRANVKDAGDRERMRECADKVFELTRSLGGVISGEHGDGTMRTPYLRKMFGAAYDLMVEIKREWDPHWGLNPLTKVLKPGSESHSRTITSDLRYGEGYERHDTGAASLQRPEVLDEIEKCHGCGKCRMYCPLMSISKEEKYSARAKANLLRGVVSGKLDPSAFLLDEEFKDNLDLCINCGQCLVDCPTQVDIPGIAMAFRENFVEKKGGVGMVGEMLSKPDRIGKLSTIMPKLTNSLLASRFTRGVAQKAFGLDARRYLPEYRKERGLPEKAKLDISEALREQLKLPSEVVIFPGCWAEYNDPDGEKNALIRILQALGIIVHTPRLNCCGISKVTQGQMAEARSDWKENLDLLAQYTLKGAPVLFSAPSCFLAATHDMPRLLQSPAGDALAESMQDAHQFLRKVFEHPALRAQLQPLSAERKELAYHQPCHSKVSKIGAEPTKLVALIPDTHTDNLDAGCCGLSGTFGMKTENFDLSMKIGARLFKRIEERKPQVVYTPCGVCQTQIAQGAPDATIVHPLTLLYEALPG